VRFILGANTAACTSNRGGSAGLVDRGITHHYPLRSADVVDGSMHHALAQPADDTPPSTPCLIIRLDAIPERGIVNTFANISPASLLVRFLPLQHGATRMGGCSPSKGLPERAAIAKVIL
jgi:hypothetical protein